MQKIFVIIMLFGCIATAEAAEVDIQFERVSLAQSMRLLPKECKWARQVLETFDEQVARLKQIDPNQSWVIEFNKNNRPIVLGNVDNVCRG